MSYCISDTGLRSLLITSDSILLHRAAYGLRATACCRANSLPSAAAFSKSALASSSWHANLRKRPLCTSPWQAVLPVPPLREMARSRSSSAPERREEACEAHTFLESWLLICYVLQAKSVWAWSQSAAISTPSDGAGFATFILTFGVCSQIQSVFTVILK